MAVQRLLAGFHSFLLWWWAGLRMPFARWLPTLSADGGVNTIVEFDPKHVRAGTVDSKAEGIKWNFDYVGSVLENTHKEQLRRWLKGRPFILRLPTCRCLVKELSLPAAVGNAIHQALEFQIDRQTPYTAEEVYYDHDILPSQNPAEQLRVQLKVVSRSAVDKAIQQTVELGAPIYGLDVVDPVSGEFRRIRLTSFEDHTSGQAKVIKWFGTAVVLIALANAVLPFILNSIRLKQLDDALSIARAGAEKTHELEAKIDAMSQRQRFIIDRRTRTGKVLDTLLEVTHLIPDDTWLTHLSISDESVELQGESKNSTKLVEMLDASPSFANPTFRSPVQTNPQTSGERFDLMVDRHAGGKK